MSSTKLEERESELERLRVDARDAIDRMVESSKVCNTPAFTQATKDLEWVQRRMMELAK